MGKKKHKNAVASLQNVEAYARLNYLYQASHLMFKQNNLELSRFYASTVRHIAERTVIRCSPEVKESICKYCHNLLVPGRTLKVKVKNFGYSVLEMKCRTCDTLVKRLPMRIKRNPRRTETEVNQLIVTPKEQQGQQSSTAER